MSERLIFHTKSRVGAAERERLLGQQGCVVWFTGLSGSGKSTLAVTLEAALVARGRMAFLVDGDNLRRGLCGDLGFSEQDRNENIRRAAAVAALFADAGVICLTAFISPLRAARAAARDVVGASRFLEIHVATPIEVCERRDTKGLYARARAGEVAAFTGISSPYEAPEHPDLRIDTSAADLDASTAQVLGLLERRGFIRPGGP